MELEAANRAEAELLEVVDAELLAEVRGWRIVDRILTRKRRCFVSKMLI